jgi:hypothetical protein
MTVVYLAQTVCGRVRGRGGCDRRRAGGPASGIFAVEDEANELDLGWDTDSGNGKKEGTSNNAGSDRHRILRTTD